MAIINMQPQNMVLNPVGKVLSIVQNPCAVPPNIWAKTLGPAVLAVAKGNALPTWKTTAKAIAGGSWIKAVKIVPELVEISTPSLSNTVFEAVFATAEWAESASYYFWLASLGADLALNWVSAAYKMQGCIKPPYQDGVYGKDPIGVISFDGKPQPLFTWHETYPNPPQILGTSLDIDSNTEWSSYCNFNPAPFFGPLEAIPFRCWDTLSGEVFYEGSSTNSDLFGLNSGLGQTGRVPPINRHRIIEWQATPANLDTDGFPHSNGATNGAIGFSWFSKSQF